MTRFFMKRFFIFLILSISVFLVNCKNETICFSGSADDFLNYCSNENDVKNLSKGIVEIEGIVAHIFMPKDGFKLNESVVYLETENCDPIKIKGNFVTCKFNRRFELGMDGQKLKIKGRFKQCYKRDSGITVSLVKCNLIRADEGSFIP